MKKLIFSLLALFLIVGCDKEEQQLQVIGTDSPVFTTSFEEYDFGEKTKTYVDEKVKLLWHEADDISIFTSTLNQKYLFDGVTGDNSGTFTMVSTGGQFGTGNEVSRNYAVYPYNAATKMNNSEEILVTLPAVQEYAQNSFGRGANTMVAVTSGLNDYFLPFKNVGGYLVLKLYAEDVTVRSIYLKGNNGEKLSGSAMVRAEYGKMPVVEMAGDAAETVEIDCGSEGVKLSRSKEEPTQFWFVVPPTFFEKGFTVCIDDINGYSMLKSSYLELTIDRNKVYSMSAIEVATESVPSNQIWYATADGEVVELGTNEGFGAAISSHVYEFGKGVITFDGPVLSIPESAFENCATLESVTIPQGVTDISSYSFRNCTNLTIVEIGEKAQVVSSDARTYNLMQTSNTRSQSSVLGAGAFFGCSRLEKVDLPKALTSIGESAFSGCASLASVKIPVGVTSISAKAFNNCSSLATIRIPENVESVGRGIFYGCTGLTDVYYMPETPPTSDASIFDSGASNITIHVPEDSFEAYLEDPVFDGFEDEIVGDADKPLSNEIWYTSIDGNVINPNTTDGFGANIISNVYEDGKGVITFDGDVIKIGSGAFSNCSTLSEVTIPNGVKIIAQLAFAQTSLKSFNVPESVDSVGINPFRRTFGVKLTGKYISDDGMSLVKDGNLISFCPGITEPMEYHVPDGVISIGAIAFFNYANITSVILPDGVTSIELGAFQLCENLASINIPSGLKTIGYYAFNRCYSLISIDIPESVTFIDEGAFANCSSLLNAYVKGGDNIQYGANPFSYCYNVKFTGTAASKDGKCLINNGELVAFSPGTTSTEAIDYILPDNITAIGTYAFDKITSLESITIPERVTNLRDGAFFGCKNLSKVTVLSVEPPQLGSGAIRNYGLDKTLYVKSASLESFKNSDWSKWFTEIKPLETTIGGGTTSYNEKEEIW